MMSVWDLLRIFALIRARGYSVSAKKEQISLFCARLFVSLQSESQGVSTDNLILIKETSPM